MASPDLVLVADIGGTNSRFGLVPAGELTPQDIAAFSNDRFEGLHAAMAQYIRDVGRRPVRAVLAIAGPIRGDIVSFTNRSDWAFRPADLARACGLARAEVVNDFAALAEALPYVDELTPLGAVAPRPEALKVALGPGTGLGVAALTYRDDRWIVVPSEAGHIEFADQSAREAAIFAVLRRGFGRVSAELVISGEGIERLDMAVAELDGLDTTRREGRVISAAARSGEARAAEVMNLFFDALARFAGDMALTFMAHGGVYIGGGVVPKTLDLMDIDRFRRIFAAKKPHERLMAEMPTLLITAKTPALTGCAAIAARG